MLHQPYYLLALYLLMYGCPGNRLMTVLVLRIYEHCDSPLLFFTDYHLLHMLLYHLILMLLLQVHDLLRHRPPWIESLRQIVNDVCVSNIAC